MATQYRVSHFPADTDTPLMEITLGDLMRGLAAEVPDRVALIEGVKDPAARRRWTYRELVDQSEALSRGLLTRFTPGDRVALFAPETPEWLLFQHAFSFAGLILVALNPAYTEREVEFVLKNAGCRGIVFAETSRGKDLRAIVEAVKPRLPELEVLVRVADIAALQAAGQASAQAGTPLPEPKPGDTLQIQYTSGTTGFPKGACLHHRGVVNVAHAVAERADFPVGGVWLNSMPMFHIGGAVVSEIGAFSRKGTFVLMQGFDPALFLELIEAEGVNASLIVPTMILALLNHPDLPRRDMSTFGSILSGATAVPAPLVQRAKDTFGCRFVITYGQTETNGTFMETFAADPVTLQSETIGRPIRHCEVKVVDPESHETLPVNTIGEFWVRGFMTMSGYYGQPEASAVTLKGDGWLRTGDLGTMDENGYFRITGRLKEMIIRGGMNLYPREVEDVLFTHPGIAQVAVIGIPDEVWGEIVAAVLLPKDPANPPPAGELHAYCRARLSPQKTPERWFFVSEFPLTASGKIQKNVLQDMVADGRLAPVQWQRPERQSHIA